MTDEPTREEKLRILMEADRAVNTLAAHQALLEPGLAGRFAKQAKADFTVGRDPVVNYPRLPPGGPWGNGPQVPDEPPFPEDINYVEPCGTPEEVERSLARVPPPLAEEAGSPPSRLSEVDLSPLPDRPSATPSLVAELVASPSSGSSADLSSNIGSATLAAPLVDAETSSEGRTPRVELRRGGAALSWRRFG